MMLTKFNRNSMKNYEDYFLKLKILFILGILLAVQVTAQEKITIGGVVLDESKNPVAGSTVIVKGTTNGTATDLDGKFSLKDVPSNSTLQVSFIGFVTQEVLASKGKILTIVLVEEAQNIGEVVVVGYGVQRKSDLTGAVSSIKASEVLKSTPTSNVSEALQGRMAGVSVVQGSGDPSSEVTIRVRGINSITAESGPLVVVDGFIGGTLKSLNPSDIQSIEVLKDASATAVYGSRGANGVILVTTKTPQKDRLVVSFNTFTNIKSVIKIPNLLSPGEFARLANNYGAEYYQSLGQPAKVYYTPEQIADFDSGKEGYNYVDNIFNHPSMAQNYEMSIAGGNDKTTVLASVRYEKNEGIIKNSLFSQFNYRLKADTKIRKWLTVGFNFWGDYSESSGPRMTQYEGLLISSMNFPNTIKPQDEVGNYNNKFAVGGLAAYNPMGHINEIDATNKLLTNRLQSHVDVTIADGLTFRSQIGFSFINALNTSMDNDKSYYFFKNSTTQAQASSQWNLSWLNTNSLNYTKEYNKNHRINATVVVEESSSNNYEHSGTSSKLMFGDRLGYDALAWADNFQTSSNRNISALLSGMLRVNYVFMNRYMFTGSMRADGSSNLENKWDYFPSIALAWDIKQESFMKNVGYMSQFKLRMGYGSVGNQSVSPYRIYSKMSPVRNPDGTTSYVVDRPKAPNLSWERNDQINAGLDLGFLNGRLTVSADVYDKLSKDILLEVNQPVHTGWSSLLKNAGEIRNRGFELTVSGDPISHKDFKWHAEATFSHNNSKFGKIPTLNKMQTQQGAYENTIFMMIEGEKLGSFWGYTSDGVWKTTDVNALVTLPDGTQKTNGLFYNVVPGQAKYVDFNKDGKINADDQRIIGNGQPAFNWGLNNTFSYKNFDFSLFVIGFHGFDIYNATKESAYNTIPSMAVDVVSPRAEFLNRWTTTNENTNVPGFVAAKSALKGFSSYFVEKGDFIKIKSLSMGYNLSAQVCKTLGISNLRVYGAIQNPFQITSYSGLDPEAALGSPLTQGADWGAYPNGRNFLIGLNFTF